MSIIRISAVQGADIYRKEYMVDNLNSMVDIKMNVGRVYTNSIFKDIKEPFDNKKSVSLQISARFIDGGVTTYSFPYNLTYDSKEDVLNMIEKYIRMTIYQVELDIKANGNK